MRKFRTECKSKDDFKKVGIDYLMENGPMRKFRLKCDLLYMDYERLPAGTVFKQREDKIYTTGKGHIYPQIVVESNPDWFEEIVEEPKGEAESEVELYSEGVCHRCGEDLYNTIPHTCHIPRKPSLTVDIATNLEETKEIQLLENIYYERKEMMCKINELVDAVNELNKWKEHETQAYMSNKYPGE